MAWVKSNTFFNYAFNYNVDGKGRIMCEKLRNRRHSVTLSNQIVDF